MTVDTSVGSKDITVAMSVPSVATEPAADDDDDTDDDDDDDADSLEDLMDKVEDIFGGPAYNNSTDIGTLYVALIDQKTQTPVAWIQTNLGINYQFEFTGIADGSYYILAGKADPDSNLCNWSEGTGGLPVLAHPDVPCTAYPTFNYPQVLTIQGNNTLDSITLGL